MMSTKSLSQILALLISLATFAAPLSGQQKTAPQKTNPAPPAKAVTKTAPADHPAAIDSLLAADSYKIYGEVKNVGQLVHSGGIGDLVDPIMKLADPPKEFKALVKFLNANAETLADSRLLFATWPARPGIPNAFVTIEMSSPEDAAKFEPKLNRLLPVLLPTPAPTPSGEKNEAAPSATQPSGPGAPVAQKTDSKSIPPQQGTGVTQPPPGPPPFIVSRSGNLIFVTDKAFKFEKLHPAGTRLLNEDPNFRMAHDRFATESVFIYINVALEDKARPKPSPQVISEEEEQARAKAEEQANDLKNAEMTPNQPDQPSPPEPEQPGENPPAETTGRLTARNQSSVVVLGSSLETPPTSSETQQLQSQAQQLQVAAFSQFGALFGLLTRGEAEWPDAVGVAIAQEGDDYVIRAVLVGPQNAKRLVLPFVPQLLAGRAFTPNAPAVLPDDTEVFVSASLDLPKTYEGMLGELETMNKERIAQTRRLPVAARRDSDEKPFDPFSDFEKKGGFKIKADLLPALGNEIAIAGSLKSMQGVGPFGIMPPPPPSPKPPPESEQSDQAKANKQLEEQGAPMLLVSVRDREAARRLMPRVLEGLGIGAANLIGTSVKREDTEMVDFVGAFAYAFVGDFLIISTTATVRHVIDSHINHRTLAANSAFRNFTSWQPRELVGQIYVSPALMEGFQKAAQDPSQMIAAAMREYLMRLNPTPQAITYALSHEGFGPFHELRLPRSFVLASVAGAASATREPPPEMNEAVAMSVLRMIVSAEATYKETTGKDSYGSLDTLVEAKLISKDMLDKYGYRFEVMASGNEFQATAIPVEYGKTGRLSYFVDQSGVVRGADHAGAPATVADKQVQ